MRTVALTFVALALLSGCGSGGGESGSDEVTVDLGEQNGSRQSGTATLTADGEKTKVVIALENPPSSPQPAHVHKGSCAKLDPSPAYGLENVVGGNSSSLLSVSLEELLDGEFAVNVHKSGTELERYVACGDIGSGSGSETNTETGYGY